MVCRRLARQPVASVPSLVAHCQDHGSQVNRACLRCGAPITACMGFVLVRDALLAEDGKIPWARVREHCGRCVVQLTAGPNGEELDCQDYLRAIPELDHDPPHSPQP
jgi:hypothetical protein